MLNDATCFKNVYIVCGFTDLRKGIDSLAAIIAERSEKNHLFRIHYICFAEEDIIRCKKRSIGT